MHSFISRSTALAAGFLFTLGLSVASVATAHGYKAGTIEIGHPWSRATLPNARVAAGYLTLTNTGSEPDRLLGAGAAIAERGEIHEMSVNSTTGVMTMRPLAEGIAIAPGETVKLEPGGFHLMFMNLNAPAVEGERFKGTLTFERAGTVDVDYAVEAAGGGGGHDHGAAGAAGTSHAH
jgi:periplasmic copper chaperone A